MRRSQRRGSSLIELMVTIVVLSVITEVATMAARRIEAPDPRDPGRVVEDSVRRAVTEGHLIPIRVPSGEGASHATAEADGSVVADSVLEIERLTGHRRHAQ